MQKTAPKNVDDYLKLFPEQQRNTLEKIRKAIKAAAPKAEESISYGIAAYKLNGPVAFFGGFKDHCSYFPAGYSVIKKFEEELKPYKILKGTIHFPVDKPLPSSLIKKMVQFKIQENEMKMKVKTENDLQQKRKQLRIVFNQLFILNFTTMASKIFVNLAVKDLKKSMDFFTQLGYSFNPQFTNEKAACMVISEDIYAMLLTEPFFKGFIPNREIADSSKAKEVLIALSADSKEKVDEISNKAIAAGGKQFREPEDNGFVFARSFEDLDGHVWEIVWMDPAHVQS